MRSSWSVRRRTSLRSGGPRGNLPNHQGRCSSSGLRPAAGAGRQERIGALRVINVYDQAARYAVKLDPAGFCRWLLPGLDPAVEFRGWLDTRTLPFPGEQDRTCDTVAALARAGEPGA